MADIGQPGWIVQHFSRSCPSPPLETLEQKSSRLTLRDTGPSQKDALFERSGPKVDPYRNMQEKYEEEHCSGVPVELRRQ